MMGKLRDDEVAVIANLVERTGLTEEMSGNGMRVVTILTPTENRTVWEMGLAALQDATAMDQVAELRKQNFTMERALREIAHARVGKNKGALIAEMQKLAASIVAGLGPDYMTPDEPWPDEEPLPHNPDEYGFGALETVDAVVEQAMREEENDA